MDNQWMKIEIVCPMIVKTMSSVSGVNMPGSIETCTTKERRSIHPSERERERKEDETKRRNEFHVIKV
jgi:hypothetical protein